MSPLRAPLVEGGEGGGAVQVARAACERDGSADNWMLLAWARTRRGMDREDALEKALGTARGMPDPLRRVGNYAREPGQSELAARAALRKGQR